MKRVWPCLLLLTAAQPSWAGDAAPPYYGPMKRWHGIGHRVGYEDRTEKDGAWRIDAAIHGRGDAIDMALYRAAERARDAGYRYVFLLGGRGSRSPGLDAATVYARPSHDPVPPTDCRSKKITSCYTADVAKVMRILGGPDGTQPGVPVLDHLDEAGREVFLSGYGTGGVATLIPGGVARSHMTTVVETRSKAARSIAMIPAPLAARPPAPPLAPPLAPPPPFVLARVTAAATRKPIPQGIASAPNGPASPAAQTRFDRALEAVTPVRGGDPKQGWTISD